MAHETKMTHRFTCDRCDAKATAKTEIPKGWARLDVAIIPPESDDYPRNALIDLCPECIPPVEKAIGVPLLPVETDG